MDSVLVTLRTINWAAGVYRQRPDASSLGHAQIAWAAIQRPQYFSLFRGEFGIEKDSLADDAVQSELLSAGNFPDLRENTGNPFILKPNHLSKISDHGTFSPNSLNIKTGNLF
jgi:hypothetical protein